MSYPAHACARAGIKDKNIISVVAQNLSGNEMFYFPCVSDPELCEGSARAGYDMHFQSGI